VPVARGQVLPRGHGGAGCPVRDRSEEVAVGRNFAKGCAAKLDMPLGEVSWARTRGGGGRSVAFPFGAVAEGAFLDIDLASPVSRKARVRQVRRRRPVPVQRCRYNGSPSTPPPRSILLSRRAWPNSRAYIFLVDPDRLSLIRQ
jgi:hypothetical protein